MSAQFVINQAIHLDRENPTLNYRGDMLHGSKNAHKWDVAVYSGGEPVQLDGATVEGYLLREDGTKVRLTGTASGNVASVVFDQYCYAVIGRVDAVMYIKQGNEVIGVSSLKGRIRGSDGTIFVDPGTPTDVVKLVLDLAYPVGSIWVTDGPEFPGTHFGFGDWMEIQNRSIIGTGIHGASEEFGNELTTMAAYVQTPEQMPYHEHNFIDTNDAGAISQVVMGRDGQYAGETFLSVGSSIQAVAEHRIKISPSGLGQPMNLVGPLHTSHIWKRTA